MNQQENRRSLWTRDFIFIILSNLLIFFGFEMMVTILPLYLSEYGAGDSIIGVSGMIFTLTAVISRALAGSWLDRLGRKLIFLCGIAGMMLATGLYIFAASVLLIILIRVLHGFFWGITSTSSDTIGSDTVPRDRFGEGMGYIGLSNSLGMATGPAFGLFLLHHASFRSTFLCAVLFLVLATVSFLQMKTVKTAEDIRREAQNAATETEQQEKKHRGFLEKNAILPASAFALVGAAYGSLVTFLALFGAQEGISNVGVFFAVYAIAMLVTRPLAGRMTDRRGYLAVVLPGLVLIAAGLLTLSVSHTLTFFLISAVLYGIGMGATQSALQAMAVGNAPPDRVGAANATFLIGFDGGIGIGSLLSGFIASATGYAIMYRSFIVLIACAAVLLLIGRAVRSGSA